MTQVNCDLCRLLQHVQVCVQSALTWGWTHLIISLVTADRSVFCAVIDSLHHFRGYGQASGVAKACAQQRVHVIVFLEISKGEHPVACKVLIGLCLHSSKIPALLQSTAAAHTQSMQSVPPDQVGRHSKACWVKNTGKKSVGNVQEHA